jgi:mRNA-degrading endonuclease RelE of RelBE toxin-antitoxin system
MGQNITVLSGVVKTSEHSCGVDMNAVNYLANVTDIDNVFALEHDSGGYLHRYESDDYENTRMKNEAGKEKGARCMYYVPTESGNYCVFYDIGDDTGTVYVINLSDTSRLVDISGKAARVLSIEQLIENADGCLEEDADNNEENGEDNDGENKGAGDDMSESNAPESNASEAVDSRPDEK